MPLSTPKQLGLQTRREVERKLISLGLSQQDIATSLGIDASSVTNDIKRIDEVEIMFDTTGLNWRERRDKAFGYAVLEWLSIDDVSEYAQRLGVDQEVARGIVDALSVFLNVRRINGIVEGVISSIENMLNPVDPPEYRPYRALLKAVFGDKTREVPKSRLLREFHLHLTNRSTQMTRDSFSSQLASWALHKYGSATIMPLDKSAKVMVDEVLKGSCPMRNEEILRLSFGLQSGEPLSNEEIGDLYNLTKERVRQIRAKALRLLQHPARSHRLRILVLSPFELANLYLEERSRPLFPEEEPGSVASTVSQTTTEPADTPHPDKLL